MGRLVSYFARYFTLSFTFALPFSENVVQRCTVDFEIATVEAK
ncbi:hypothetical protein [Dyadobacter linearis]|nr:hypothetical protein [Dyadobacter sp. CECT 9623]